MQVNRFRPTILLCFTPEARANYYGDKALAGLQALGEVRLHESDEVLQGASLVRAAAGCQVVVSYRSSPAAAEVFAGSPDLAVFMRCAMDIRNIDVAAASAHGVLVTHASAGFMNSVSEWVIGALIDLARGISDSVLAYRAGIEPAAVVGRELRGSTLGIIGYGQIGRRLAELGLALGMRVIVADPAATVAHPQITQLALDDLLAEADHVVCLAPALSTTENLMNARRFALMKRGAVFVNPSRGSLVDEDALLHALDSGQLAACALDVGRAPDQMPSLALARHPRVVATPHIGGLTPPAAEHQALETVAQLAELLRGGMPAGAANPDHATRLRQLLA